MNRKSNGALIMKKEAMNLFQTYKQHVDADGNHLHMEGGRWVNDEGVPVEGENPVKRRIDRPVMTAQDLHRSSAILEKVLPLEKYKDIIKELQDATSIAKSGVVNFVIGRETDMADAIMKAAFPPGSGIVYKGVDGYSIDASEWQNPAQAKAKMTQLIKGRQRVLSRADYEMFQDLNDEIPGISGLLDGAGGPAAATPAAPATRQRGRGAAQPSAATPAEPQDAIGAILDMIDALNTTLEQIRTKKKSIDRFDKTLPPRPPAPERTQQNPNPVRPPQEPSPASVYEALVLAENACISKILAQQDQLHKYSDWFGQPEYDKSGFMDFQYDNQALSRQLSRLLSPNKLFAAGVIQNARASHGASDVSEDVIKDRIFESCKVLTVTNFLQPLKMHAPPNIEEAVDNILSFLENDNQTILTSLTELRSLVTKLMQELTTQNKVLVLNNVSDSPLVSKKGGGAEGHVSTVDNLISDEFISTDARNKRCMVFVSRKPVEFGFDGVEIVTMRSSTVDDEEGEALIGHFISRYRNEAQKNGLDVSSIRINRSDISKLNMVLQGRTQTAAIHLLNKVFMEALDKDTMVLNGDDLWKAGSRVNNDEVKNAAAGDGGGGETRGCYHQTPQITMDQYIRSKRSDWGKHVNKVNLKVDTNAEKEERLNQIRDEIWSLQESNGSVVERRELEREQENLENEIHSSMQGIRHFMILTGAPGCGKSAYPEALANKLGYQMLDVDLGQTRGSLVGQTEQWSKALIDSWKKLSNVVIRIDEMDGQLVSGQAEARESHGAAVIKLLLSFFQDFKDVLIERNVFIIGTTNNPDRIRGAIKDRAKTYEVPEPFDAEGYNEYLEKASGILRSDSPRGYIYDPDNPNRSKDLWPETDALMETVKPAFPEIAKRLEKSGLNFRRFGDWLTELWEAHMNYVTSTRKKRMREEDPERFKKEFVKSWTTDEAGNDVLAEVKVEGFPFTAENILKAAKSTYPVDLKGNKISVEERRSGVDGDIHSGVNDVEEALSKVFNREMEVGEGELSLEFKDQDDAPEMDLFAPPDESTLASTDYYYNQLQHFGIIKDAKIEIEARKKKPVPAPTRGIMSDFEHKNQELFTYGTIAIMHVPSQIQPKKKTKGKRPGTKVPTPPTTE
jgi:hypothetical protein